MPKKLIEKRLNFLVEKGYSYSYVRKKRLFSEHKFEKNGCIIMLSYDWHLEFVDLLIKKGTQVLIKTSYGTVGIDHINQDEEFSCLLKTIYSIPRGTYSLSKIHIKKIIELYARCIKEFTDLEEMNNGLH